MSAARCAIAAATLCAAALVFADQPGDRPPHERRRDDWRPDALQNLRIASSEHMVRDGIEAYRSAGFNALVVFDVDGVNGDGTAWNFKSQDEVRDETAFARSQNLPLVIGLAVEPYGSSTRKRRPFAAFTLSAATDASIPGATDDQIRARVALWKQYGDDVVLGVFPWYDDVFWQRVDIERQRHVYRIIKGGARDWYVFGMIGDFGFSASDEDVALLYDPSSFDHLIVLMYPYNLGAAATGVVLDNVASADPDGDLVRYVDRYIETMTAKFFAHLRPRQLILVVVQAFYYTNDPEGRRPRPADIDIMTRRAGDDIRTIGGQEHNYSAAYFYWGGNASIVGITNRPDWFGAIANVNRDLDRERDRSR